MLEQMLIKIKEKIDNGAKPFEVAKELKDELPSDWGDKQKYDWVYRRAKRAVNQAFEVLETEMLRIPDEKIGIVSDTHFGSIDAQITSLCKAYDIFKENGVTTVLHAGDITEGMRMRYGHENECYLDGVDNFVEHIQKVYPNNGIKTLFITGNHDQAFLKRSGVNIGKQIAGVRPDMIYLGDDLGLLEANGVKIELRHPKDGAQEVAQVLKRIVNSFQSADEIPDVLICGHYHKASFFPYKGCFCVGAGGFQGLTSFMRGKSSYADVGGWILTMGRTITPEFIPMPTIKNDYRKYLYV